MTIYTAADAVEMLRNAGIDAAAELSNLSAAFASVTDEIADADGVASFTADEFAAALRATIH